MLPSPAASWWPVSQPGDGDAVEEAGKAKSLSSRGEEVSPQTWQPSCTRPSWWPSRSATKTCFWTTETWTFSRWSCWRMKGCSFWRDCTWRETPSLPWYLRQTQFIRLIDLFWVAESSIYWEMTIYFCFPAWQSCSEAPEPHRTVSIFMGWSETFNRWHLGPFE